MKPYLIGITGGSASGKTLFLNKLTKSFTEAEICLISQDNYYFPRDKQPLDPKGVQNFDTPESIDAEALASDLRKVKIGEDFEREEYTFNNPNVVPEMLHFKAAPIIVVEGLFVMHYPKVKELLDLKVFIDTREHIQLKRRIVRDKVERGYDLDDVLYRFENHVMPMYDRYLNPLKDEADLVIPNNTNFDQALEVVSGFLRMRLQG